MKSGTGSRAGLSGAPFNGAAAQWSRSMVGFALASLLNGCIFPEPPEYQEPAQTPPFMWSIEPTTTEVIRRSSGKPLDISVNVRSQDNGSELWASLYLNYRLNDNAAKEEMRVRWDAGTIDEARFFTLHWTVPYRPTPGTCEQLSLVVSQQSNFDENFVPKDYRYVGIVTWWLDINDSEETLGQCPRGNGAGGSQ